MSTRRKHIEMLGRAGRLLLEYDESTAAIQRALTSTANAVADEPCEVVVGYGGVAVSLAGEGPMLVPVRELRYNMALQARIHDILEQVRRGELDCTDALAHLCHAEADTPRHSRWLITVIFGIAASALAGLLGADAGAVLVVGMASGLGLLARQELGRHRLNLLLLPLTAAFIGALLGGLAIQVGWTRTPAPALVVPALMLVPGPHLINGLLDLIDNHLPMSVARLWLATGILLASALGLVIGIELTLPTPFAGDPGVSSEHLNIFSDMFLAALVTCGFAVFYNAPWPQVGMAAVGGMVGHGSRFLALEAGCWLELATLLGGFGVGIVSAVIVRHNKMPIAVIAFAGAVTMMPGLQMYRAFVGALQMAHAGSASELATVAGTVGNFSQAFLVVGALVVGLIVGTRTVPTLCAEKDSVKEGKTLCRSADSESTIAKKASADRQTAYEPKA